MQRRGISTLPAGALKASGGIHLLVDLAGLVAPETLARVGRARQGEDVSKRLRIGQLQVGDVGVLRARVASIAPPRTFSRKNGTQGLIGRVTFDDGTGEVEAVLWDDANRLTRDGTLSPNQHVTLQGVVVQAGWRGGVEISLEHANIEPINQEASELKGQFQSISDTRMVAGRFQADACIETDGQQVQAVVWDERVKQLRGLEPGETVSLPATPHPLLDGWYLVDDAPSP